MNTLGVSDGAELPVEVRAETGQVRSDGWVRCYIMALRQRLFEAGRFAVIGVVVGAVFLVVPLLHLLGVVFALVMLVLAGKRLGTTAVLAAAGGICPRCDHKGTFFVGLSRRRLRLPTNASCNACGIALTLSDLSPKDGYS